MVEVNVRASLQVTVRGSSGAIVMIAPGAIRGFLADCEPDIVATLDPDAKSAQSEQERLFLLSVAAAAPQRLARECFLRGIVFVTVHDGGDYSLEVRVDEGLSDEELSRRLHTHSAQLVVDDAEVVICPAADLGQTKAHATVSVQTGKYRVEIHGLSVDTSVVRVFGSAQRPALIVTLEPGGLNDPPAQLPAFEFRQAATKGLSMGNVVRARVKRVSSDGIAILELLGVGGFAQTQVPRGKSLVLREEIWVKLLGVVPGVKGRWAAERVPPPV